MSGVEILSIIEEPICQFNKLAFGTTLFFTLVICFFIGAYISMTECDWFYFVLFSVLGVTIGVSFGVVAGAIACIETDEIKTTYKVTISEEVSLNDFMEKYEIIDQEGKIYTVRERE